MSLSEGSFRSSGSKTARKSPEESLVLRDKPLMPQISVLLVDNKPNNLKVLSAYMIRHNVGFSAAENGRKAVEFFLTDPGKYACILMSTSMPVMDGFEATRQIRAYEAHMGLAPVLIIALSVMATKDAQQEALESGMNTFLTHPVNPGALGILLESRGVLNGSGNRLFPKRLLPSSTNSSTMNSFSSTLLN
ncbi:CheY-like superfamily [Trichoderma camerunense]